jgi:hypothetical protein
MIELSRTVLLEADVVERAAASWEWRVRSGDYVYVVGFEQTR